MKIVTIFFLIYFLTYLNFSEEKNKDCQSYDLKLKEARDFFHEKVYKNVVPRNVRLSEAPSHGAPVLMYDKTCPGSKAYFNFTNEFLEQEKLYESAA